MTASGKKIIRDHEPNHKCRRAKGILDAFVPQNYVL